jgi:CzcA family heavy metal efflux pump
MLSAIVRSSLRHAILVVAGAVLFMFAGVYWVWGTPIDVFPALSATHISIVTPAPGMVSEQVEQLVTRPVEYAVLGAAGVDSVHSQSAQSISQVQITLRKGVDAERTRSDLSARLTLANSDFPSGVGPALIAPLASGTSDILELGLTAPHLSAAQLRDIAQWTIRPRLLSTSGVSRVGLYGGETRRIEVQARSGDLADSDLGFPDVVDAVHRATSVQGSGFIDTPDQRIFIDPRGQALTTKDVAAGQIHVTGGAPVRVGDVSDVKETTWPANSDALVDGEPAVLLDVGSQLGTTVVSATRNVDTSLANIRGSLATQGITINSGVNRAAGFITRLVRDIVIRLLVGAILVALFLVLLLRDWRAAMISIITIPFALLTALLMIRVFDWTINVMTMGGLVVALGLVADDAVLDVENIVSDLRDAEAMHTSRARAILLASLEVRQPVIYATLIIIIALLPIALLGGTIGALLSPLAVMIIVGCMAAILAALTITPALAFLFLGHLSPGPHPQWLVRVKDRYLHGLQAIWQMRRFYAIATGGALALAALLAAFFTVELLPPIHDGYLSVEYDAPAATSLAVMRQYGIRISRELLQQPGIVHVYQRAGRADFGDDTSGIEHAELEIALLPGLSMSAQDRAQERIKSLLATFRGITATVRSRLVTQVLGPKASSRATVRIYGPDLDGLDQVARRVAAVLRTLPDAGPVKIQADSISPVVRVDLNFQRLALYGLSSADVLSTVQTAFEGTRAAQIFHDGQEIDIAVTAEAKVRRDPEAVGDLLIRSSQGISAPLKYVANVYLTDGRYTIEHDNGIRRQTVSLDPSGNLRSFIKSAQDIIGRQVHFPPGTYLEYGSVEEAASSSTLFVYFGMSTFAVLALLFFLYADSRASLFILGSTLFSAVGGIVVVAALGGVLSLGAFMGFVVLFGISTRNAILLLSQIKYRMATAGTVWSPQTVFMAARERFSPIVISSCVVGAALLPLALSAGRAGLEILGPMVLVILGGLLTSVVMSLLLSPPVVLWLWRATPFIPDGVQDEI